MVSRSSSQARDLRWWGGGSISQVPGTWYYFVVYRSIRQREVGSPVVVGEVGAKAARSTMIRDVYCIIQYRTRRGPTKSLS